MSKNASEDRFYSPLGPGKDLTVGEIIDKGIDRNISRKHIYELTNEDNAYLNKLTGNKFDKTLKTLMNNQNQYNQNQYNQTHRKSHPKELNYLQYTKSLEEMGKKSPWTQFFENEQGSKKRVMNYIGSGNLQRMGLEELGAKKIKDLTKKEMETLNEKTNNRFIETIKIASRNYSERNNERDDDKDSEKLISLKSRIVSGYSIPHDHSISKDRSSPGISSVEQAVNYSKQYQKNGYVSPGNTSSGTNKNADEVRNKIANGFKNKDFSR